MKKHKNFLFLIITVIAFALSISIPSKAQAAVTQASIINAVSGIDENDAPVWIYVPSIGLFSSIQDVGIDRKGNMDVPSGRTNSVGWYKYGVKPGNTGTAVLDAHNTAAFRNLNALKPGSDIYIFSAKGKLLHFAVTDMETYPVATLNPATLFKSTNAKQINLITCAGSLLGNGEATHRLIVSAQLV